MKSSAAFRMRILANGGFHLGCQRVSSRCVGSVPVSSFLVVESKRTTQFSMAAEFVGLKLNVEGIADVSESTNLAASLLSSDMLITNLGDPPFAAEDCHLHLKAAWD